MKNGLTRFDCLQTIWQFYHFSETKRDKFYPARAGLDTRFARFSRLHLQ